MSVKCHLCGQRRTDDTNGGGGCRCAGGYSAYHDIQKKADAFDDELRFQREIANLRHDIERHVGIATEATQEVEQLRAELAASRERFAKADAAFEREQDRALAAEVRAETAEAALAASREREARLLALLQAADVLFAHHCQDCTAWNWLDDTRAALAEGAQG